jgi:lysophospholipase L1-like esterase
VNSTQTSWLRRHPVLVLIGVNTTIFLLVMLIAEIALRLYIPYNPGYYMSVEGTSREVVYPYGVIKINSHGFPDDEFDMSKGRNVGYIGDSVTYGVGAGHGYRFSDLLSEAYPQYEHMNFSGIGLSVTQGTIEHSVRLVEEFDLDLVAYFFNLNDIVPDSAVSPGQNSSDAQVPRTRSLRMWVLENVDWLRGRSYVYTWLRTLAKNYLEAQGVGFHGYRAYELHPSRERQVLAETARRINLFRSELAKHGADFILVLLPYEMQISQEAAETYSAHGIAWEDGFIEGSAQRIIIEELDPAIRYIDLYPAFVDAERPDRSRDENGVGEFFVYNRGDKLDWNHPNRLGHRAIAEYLTRVDFLGTPSSPGTAHADRADEGR